MKNILNHQTAPSKGSLRLLWFILLSTTKKRKLQLLFSLVLVFICASAELISIGSALPFLTVLSNPDVLLDNQYLAKYIQYFDITKGDQLIVPITLLFVSAVVTAGLVRLLDLWVTTHLAASIGSDISRSAFAATIQKPYHEQIYINSSEIINTLTIQIKRTVGAIDCSLRMLTSFLISAFILFGLFYINFNIALTSISIVAFSYLFLAVLNKSSVRINGFKFANSSTRLISILQESLGASRDIQLDGSFNQYIKEYSKADYTARKYLALNIFLAAYPKFVIEILALVSFALATLLFLVKNNDSSNILPVLGTLALGSQKLLPAVNNIYSSWTTLVGFEADLKAIVDIISRPIPHSAHNQFALAKFSRSIKLENVHFSYSESDSQVLSGITLEVLKGTSIGLIGETGGGKSTLLDIIIGLLPPSSGKILVDGTDINNPCNSIALKCWRQQIAHVPQKIFLADTTIAENIAFTGDPDEIDFNKLEKASIDSQIYDYIQSLPLGFNTFVGERGVRLSGGQIQRIGIARALYKQSQILVLDEATSALDPTTEHRLMKSILETHKDITLIMISHRLSTLKNCDQIAKVGRNSFTLYSTPSEVSNAISNSD